MIAAIYRQILKKLFGFVNEIILYGFADDFPRWDEANSGPCLTNHTAEKRGKENKRTRLINSKQLLTQSNMLASKINVFRSHGVQYIKHLGDAVLPGIFRGRPRITPGIAPGEALALVSVCPSGAIGYDAVWIDEHDGLPMAVKGLSIDMGRCVFCGECTRHSPAHVAFTNNHRMASNTRHGLVVAENGGDETPFDRDAVRREIPRLFHSALKLREVSAGGDNASEMELNASMNVNFDLPRYGIEFMASPRHADGVVVSGPITSNMARPLEICYNAVPQPRVVIMAGADAISGGLFAGSDALDRGFVARHRPDLYLPGNPVHPLTFIDGVMKLCGRELKRSK